MTENYYHSSQSPNINSDLYILFRLNNNNATAEFRNSEAVVARQREGKRMSIDMNWQHATLVTDRNIMTKQYSNAMFSIWSAQADRTAGISYCESSRQYRSVQEEAVPEDGECTVSRCGCGTGTIPEPRKGNVAVGSRYQRTGVGQQTERTKCVS
jgi:hypothetical protein